MNEFHVVMSARSFRHWITAILTTVVLSCAAPAGGQDKARALFDGKSLDGWQGDTAGYEAQDGVLVCTKAGRALQTEKTYGNFILRFEFKLAHGGNNGIAIRAPTDGRISRTGMEIQVLDDSAEKYKTLKDYQYHGSVYGLVPARRGHLKPVGEWNQQEILCQGRHIKVTLNGAVIVDANLDDLGQVGLDGHEHPGRYRNSGHVGFIGHRSRVDFRNLRIKELETGKAG